jgi:peptidoglycan/LPS O-acetylase OafA/YrhL
MPALDGLRGLAIALVLLHNLCGIDAHGNRVLRVVDSALTIGWVGVQLFFVLSGFLITGILLDDRG